jgi:hypothetical protein
MMIRAFFFQANGWEWAVAKEISLKASTMGRPTCSQSDLVNCASALGRNSCSASKKPPCKIVISSQIFKGPVQRETE